MVRFLIGGRFRRQNVFSRHGRHMSTVFFAACAALALAATARASTFSWTKNSSSNWNNTANWSGGAVPSAAGTGDYVLFGLAPTSGTITSTLDISPTVGALVYNNTAGGSYWAISSSTSNGPYSITMNNTGGSNNPWGDATAAIVSTSKGHFVVNSNITMTGDLYVGTAGTSQTSMFINGNITSSSRPADPLLSHEHQWHRRFWQHPLDRQYWRQRQHDQYPGGPRHWQHQ